MSIVPKEAIEVVAQSIGITNLSPDVALALAPDVEYRVREIMQEAIKCMRHSRQTTLTTDDVDSALKLRNVEPIYGFASGDHLRFKRAAGHKDLFYVDNKDVEFKDVIEAPLPKAPLDVSVAAHWLAIEGVQPAIPENAPVEALAASSDGKKPDSKEDGLPIDIKLPIKHVLSRELQLYFEKVTDITVNRPGSIIFKEVLISLATDSGLHPLVPYFIYFIADEVTRNMNNFSQLFALMRLARSLLQNPHLHIEPYLHQLMPSVITCLVAKRLGNRVSDNHWELRNFAANLVASICKRFGHVYHNLQPRVTKTLLHAFLDPTKALPQQYGAIQGLAALGPSVVLFLTMYCSQNLTKQRFTKIPFISIAVVSLQHSTSVLTRPKCFTIPLVWVRHWNTSTAISSVVLCCVLRIHALDCQNVSFSVQFIMLPDVVQVRLIILPNLEPYMQLLEPEMLLEKQKNEIKRHEAWRVYGALLYAAGQCMHDRLKKFRSVFYPPSRAILKSNGKIAPVMTNKRKASTDNLMQQPPLKKLATDGSMGPMAMNSMQADMQGAGAGFSTGIGASHGGVSSMSRQLPNENFPGRELGGQMTKTSSVLAQAWKEDMDAGQLLASLFEYFGQSVFTFTPKPELSFFL